MRTRTHECRLINLKENNLLDMAQVPMQPYYSVNEIVLSILQLC